MSGKSCTLARAPADEDTVKPPHGHNDYALCRRSRHLKLCKEYTVQFHLQSAASSSAVQVSGEACQDWGGNLGALATLSTGTDGPGSKM